jgi:hypothetical protein
MELINTREVMGSQFMKDCLAGMAINDGYMTRGWYNLIVSIRDLGLYQNGMKPHRYWKISDVKNYFGIKGNKTAIYDQLIQLREEYKKS